MNRDKHLNPLYWRIYPSSLADGPMDMASPRYALPFRDNVEAEALYAIPKAPKGPFECHDNGHGCIHITGDNLFLAIPYFRIRVGNTNEVDMQPEEALWIAETIMNALGQSMSDTIAPSPYTTHKIP